MIFTEGRKNQTPFQPIQYKLALRSCVFVKLQNGLAWPGKILAINKLKWN